jgi:glycosyltransferase involved in cell wall biosynthesis
MKISACMIVKNEENNLARCLKSIKDKVDEIIIVDTGSTDDTKRIAQKYTKKIYNLKWEEADGLGNFARARNFSISKATGDYIFWIDADEELFDLSNSFRSLINNNPESVLFRQAHCLPAEDHQWSADQLHDRMFKRGDIKFVGVIHEFPSKSDDGQHYLPNSVFQNDCYILHYGLANMREKAHKAVVRNGPLVEKNLKMYPNSPVAKYYLLGLYWSKQAFDLDNPEYKEKSFAMWDEYFIHQGAYMHKLAGELIQRFMMMEPEKYHKNGNWLGRTQVEADWFAHINT